MKEKFEISRSRACRLSGLNRSSYYYQPKDNPFNEALVLRVKEIASSRVRFGYQRICVMLRREGWQVNRKRVYRLYCLEGMQLARKKKKKRPSHKRLVTERAGRVDEKWSMDFVTDRFENGQYFRMLTVVDQYSRECITLHAGKSLRGVDVARCLNLALRDRRIPRTITVDNGAEFYSEAMDSWAYRNGVELDFIRPGKPVENHYIESFNGRLRNEYLNTHLFFDLKDAQNKLDRWREDYNIVRPHSALRSLPLAEFANMAKRQINKAEKLEC